MPFFGFMTSNEVEEEKRAAARKAAEQTKNQIERNNATSLSNLSRGSQVRFAIPYFDVFDPRFEDFGCPVAIHVSLVYAIDDLDRFRQINKTETYSDESFQTKLKGQVTKYVKTVITNAPAEHHIPVVKLEQKILELSNIVQQMVTPQIEQLFGIKVRSLDITNILIDKESRGYRELRAVSADLEKDRLSAQNSMSIFGMKKQQEMEIEMKQMQTVEAMRMQMENQREMMRIQREGLADGQQAMINEAQENGRVSRLFGGANMFGGMGQTTLQAMGGMAPPPMPQATLFYVFLNGQQMGPLEMNTLSQLVEQGQMDAQTQVWTQGMPQWAPAGSVPALVALFAPPPMGGATPPPMGGNNGSLPTPTL